MSARAEILQTPDLAEATAQSVAGPKAIDAHVDRGWNPSAFAREQILGLVRQVFFSGGTHPVKQVVFSAIEHEMGVADICQQVGKALARETHGHIAVVAAEAEMPSLIEIRREEHGRDTDSRNGGTKSPEFSIRAANNLWLVPEKRLSDCGQGKPPGTYWRTRLAELRSEFEYSIVSGPPAGTSSEAVLLGQLADGIILVLGAHSSRRASARKLKETLEAAQARILGTVLSDRMFPVPEQIYRRL